MEYNFKTMEDFPAIKSQGEFDRETNYLETPYDDRLVIYTSDNTRLFHFKKRVLANPDEWKVERIYKTSAGDVTGYEFSCPKDFLGLKTKRRTLTDEQKAAQGARIRKYTEEKKKQKA